MNWMNPARPFIVWLSTQIVALFVIIDVIPAHSADVYVEALAQGITYIIGAAMSFYYMKKLYDDPDKIRVPKDKIEEFVKNSISYIPYTSNEDQFHTKKDEFFTMDDTTTTTTSETDRSQDKTVSTSTPSDAQFTTFDEKK